MTDNRKLHFDEITKSLILTFIRILGIILQLFSLDCASFASLYLIIYQNEFRQPLKRVQGQTV